MSGIVLPALDTALDCSVAPGYSALGYWLRGLRWDNAVAGRLDGGAAVVTGESSGLGVAAVEGLARAGARVHLVVRDRERGERARDEVLQRLGAAADLRVALCDLAELESVARLGADLAEREPDLAVLVNNAGVLAERRERSSSGAELTFATNVLGPFALTELLLPPCARARRGAWSTCPRAGCTRRGSTAPTCSWTRRTSTARRLYAHTKRAEVVLNELWSAREGATGVRLSRHAPGLGRHAGPAALAAPFHRLTRPLLRDARAGRRHHRLAGHRARRRGFRAAGSGTTGARGPRRLRTRIDQGPPGLWRIQRLATPMSRVAVVGAGVAGLVAAYELTGRPRRHLFEARAHAGGHTNTVAVETEGGRTTSTPASSSSTTATTPTSKRCWPSSASPTPAVPHELLGLRRPRPLRVLRHPLGPLRPPRPPRSARASSACCATGAASTARRGR